MHLLTVFWLLIEYQLFSTGDYNMDTKAPLVYNHDYMYINETRQGSNKTNTNTLDLYLPLITKIILLRYDLHTSLNF